MDIDWGPPGTASRSFEASFTALRGAADQNQQAGQGGYDVALSPLGWWILLLFIVVCRMATPDIPDEQHRRGREIRESARRWRLQQRAQREQRRPQLSDPVARWTVLQNSLEVQQVTSAQGSVLTLAPCQHDGGGGVDSDVKSRETQNRKKTWDGHSRQVNGEVGTDEANASLCVICLDPFETGDFVAWSRRSTEPNSKWEDHLCSHVFHRDCIVPWLMSESHDDCPSCRQIVFCFDEKDDNSVDGSGPLNVGVAGDDRCKRSEINVPGFADMEPSRSLFIVVHGLVSKVTSS